jgi:hypothetical protein
MVSDSLNHMVQFKVVFEEAVSTFLLKVVMNIHNTRSNVTRKQPSRAS